jgi:hypothetical protein
VKIAKFSIVVVILFSAAAAGFVSCGGSGAYLNQISVTPADTTVATGTQSQQQFTASESLSDNSMTINASDVVTWTYSSPIISMSAFGLASLSGSATGTATVTATDTINHISNTATFSIEDPISTFVTPTTPYMAINSTYQFSALAVFPNTTTTQNLAGATSILNFSETDIGGTGTTVLTTGAVTAGTIPGPVIIKALYSYFDGTNTHTCPQGSTTLTVTNTVLSALTINPAIPTTYTLATSPPQQFTAQGTFPGDPPTGYLSAPWIWTSSNTAVATIAGNGIVTFVATGTTVIYAEDPITTISSAGVTITVQ